MPDPDRRLRQTPPELLPPIEVNRSIGSESNRDAVAPQIIVVHQQPAAYPQYQERLGAGGWFTRAFAATSGYMLAVMVFSLGGLAVTMFLCCEGLALFSHAAAQNAREVTKRLEEENDRKEAELRRDEQGAESIAPPAPMTTTEPGQAPAFVSPPEDSSKGSANDAKSQSEPEQEYPWRTWTTKDGKFSTEAHLVSRANEDVKLRKRDGTVITVDMYKLIEDDQKWLDLPRSKRLIKN